MFKKISDFFTGDPNKKRIQELVKVVDKVNALEPNFEKLTDEELKAADLKSITPPMLTANNRDEYLQNDSTISN